MGELLSELTNIRTTLESAAVVAECALSREETMNTVDPDKIIRLGFISRQSVKKLPTLETDERGIPVKALQIDRNTVRTEFYKTTTIEFFLEFRGNRNDEKLKLSSTWQIYAGASERIFSLSCHTRDSAALSSREMSRLMPFVPKIIAEAIKVKLISADNISTSENILLGSVPGAVIFADTSGFTAMTERLASESPACGAEMVGKVMNRFLSILCDISTAYGGDILKFSGDAVSVFFPATYEVIPQKVLDFMNNQNTNNEKGHSRKQNKKNKNTHKGNPDQLITSPSYIFGAMESKSGTSIVLNGDKVRSSHISPKLQKGIKFSDEITVWSSSESEDSEFEKYSSDNSDIEELTKRKNTLSKSFGSQYSSLYESINLKWEENKKKEFQNALNDLYGEKKLESSEKAILNSNKNTNKNKIGIFEPISEVVEDNKHSKNIMTKHFSHSSHSQNSKLSGNNRHKDLQIYTRSISSSIGEIIDLKTHESNNLQNKDINKVTKNDKVKNEDNSLNNMDDINNKKKKRLSSNKSRRKNFKIKAKSSSRNDSSNKSLNKSKSFIKFTPDLKECCCRSVACAQALHDMLNDYRCPRLFEDLLSPQEIRELYEECLKTRQARENGISGSISNNNIQAEPRTIKSNILETSGIEFLAAIKEEERSSVAILGDLQSLEENSSKSFYNSSDSSSRSNSLSEFYSCVKSADRTFDSYNSSLSCKDSDNENSTDSDERVLSLHIGVGVGDLAVLQIGGVIDRWEYVFAGPPIDQVAIAEPLASINQTVISPEVYELIKENVECENVEYSFPNNGYRRVKSNFKFFWEDQNIHYRTQYKMSRVYNRANFNSGHFGNASTGGWSPYYTDQPLISFYEELFKSIDKSKEVNNEDTNNKINFASAGYRKLDHDKTYNLKYKLIEEQSPLNYVNNSMYGSSKNKLLSSGDKNLDLSSKSIIIKNSCKDRMNNSTRPFSIDNRRLLTSSYIPTDVISTDKKDTFSFEHQLHDIKEHPVHDVLSGKVLRISSNMNSESLYHRNYENNEYSNLGENIITPEYSFNGKYGKSIPNSGRVTIKCLLNDICSDGKEHNLDNTLLLPKSETKNQNKIKLAYMNKKYIKEDMKSTPENVSMSKSSSLSGLKYPYKSYNNIVKEYSFPTKLDNIDKTTRYLTKVDNPNNELYNCGDNINSVTDRENLYNTNISDLLQHNLYNSIVTKNKNYLDMKEAQLVNDINSQNYKLSETSKAVLLDSILGRNNKSDIYIERKRISNGSTQNTIFAENSPQKYLRNSPEYTKNIVDSSSDTFSYTSNLRLKQNGIDNEESCSKKKTSTDNYLNASKLLQTLKKSKERSKPKMNSHDFNSIMQLPDSSSCFSFPMNDFNSVNYELPNINETNLKTRNDSRGIQNKEILNKKHLYNHSDERNALNKNKSKSLCNDISSPRFKRKSNENIINQTKISDESQEYCELDSNFRYNTKVSEIIKCKSISNKNNKLWGTERKVFIGGYAAHPFSYHIVTDNARLSTNECRLLHRFVPHCVFHRACNGKNTFIDEIRNITVVFINCEGINASKEP